MRKSALICCLLFIVQFTFSQSKKAFQQDYLLAKSMFEDSNYVAAMDAFKLLTVEDKNNSFGAYAYYYCGLSAFNLSKYADARFILLEAEKSFPNWRKKDELYYLLGAVLIAEGDSGRAVSYLTKIEDESVLEEAHCLLTFYDINQPLCANDDLEILKSQLLDDPESVKIAKRIARALNKEGNTIEEKIYLEYLIQDYGLNPEKFESGIFRKSIKKESYSVAVILPFNYDNKRKLNARLRYYEMLSGMRLAVSRLKERGINIQLHIFDSRNDTNQVKQILKDTKVMEADLLFGPVYPKPAQLVATYASDHEKMYVNPLSGHESLILGNRFTYLYGPSYNLEAKEVARFADTLVGQDVVILYGDKEKDSIMAFSYKLEIEKKGKEVSQMKRFDRTSMSTLSHFIERVSKRSKALSHIYVASSYSFFGASVLSSVEEHDIKVPLFLTIDWLNIDMIGNDFELFHRRKVHFVGVNYLDRINNIHAQLFRQKSFAKWHAKPQHHESYGAIGYEALQVFGEALSMYGNAFYTGLGQQTMSSGEVFPGYDYKEHCNSVVPIYYLNEEYNIQLLNPIEDEY